MNERMTRGKKILVRIMKMRKEVYNMATGENKTTQLTPDRTVKLIKHPVPAN